MGVSAKGGAVLAVVTLAQVRAHHPPIGSIRNTSFDTRLAAVVIFDVSGGRRHCILVVKSRLFNFQSEIQEVPLQDALLGLRSDSYKLG